MTVTVRQALAQADRLAAVTATPRLDVEVLLAHVLQCPRSWLYSRPEHHIDDSQHEAFMAMLARRVQGEPVAYLTGHQAFWTLDLTVTPAVLIPRPETELLVEQALLLIPDDSADLADLGTGSGAVALALATERPGWRITATDCSADALAVASGNAGRLGVTSVVFTQGSWCEALQENTQYDMLVSNPPYIDPDDAHLAHATLAHEPRLALVSGEEGLADIRMICEQARRYLRPGGFLLLEHGHGQGEQVRNIMARLGYRKPRTLSDLAGHGRVTQGRWHAESGSEGVDDAG